jgi:hypothetical protein
MGKEMTNIREKIPVLMCGMNQSPKERKRKEMGIRKNSTIPISVMIIHLQKIMVKVEEI